MTTPKKVRVLVLDEGGRHARTVEEIRYLLHEKLRRDREKREAQQAQKVNAKQVPSVHEKHAPKR